MQFASALRFALLFAISASAQATIGPVTLNAPVLTQDQTGLISVTMAQCDSLATLGVLDRSVVVANGIITVTVVGLHADPADDLCVTPPTRYDRQIGPFAAGQYVVHLLRSNYFAPNLIDELGSVNLTVIAARPIPASGAPALLLIALVLLLGAVAVPRGKPE